MNCSHCSKEIPEHHIDSRTMIGVCETCSTLSYCTDELLPVPSYIKVDMKDEELSIIRPFNIDGFLVFLTLFLDICLSFSFIIWAVKLIKHIFSNPSVIMLAIYMGIFLLLLFGASVVVFMNYYSLACFVNKTFIKLKNGEFSLECRPLPGYGNTKIKLSDIEKIYSVEELSDGTPVAYKINCILKNKDIINMVTNIKKPEDALFIQRQIEDYVRRMKE
ncbi:MAG: hypothetical protein ABRQ38_21250 [Candidatus Eremiobacterota bacterium]